MAFKKGDKAVFPALKGNKLAVKAFASHLQTNVERYQAGWTHVFILREKECELIAALGGDPSPQERVIIADAVKTMLYVGTLDEYLISLDGGIVAKGKVIPVVDRRTKLAGHLREDLRALGLHRRVKTLSLSDVLSQEDDGSNEQGQ
jgi:hypothetical protein